MRRKAAAISNVLTDTDRYSSFPRASIHLKQPHHHHSFPTLRTFWCIRRSLVLLCEQSFILNSFPQPLQSALQLLAMCSPPIFSGFEKPKFFLYENRMEEREFGDIRAVMIKEHAVSSNRCKGATYYQHYYSAGIIIQENSSPTESVQDSAANLAAIGPNHPQYIEIKNCSDAEALVAKFPDSSKAWVDGALTYFHYGGIDKGKEFLQRGIKTINSRERQEKLNLWKALMIMEAEFGSREGLLATFEEALKHNKKRDFCLQMMRLWIDNGKTEELEIIKNRILRKFKSRKEVYLVLCEYYMKRGAKEEVRSLLERSLQYVPPKEHPDILKNFENLEQKYGA